MPVRFLAHAAGAYGAQTVPVSYDNVTDDTPTIAQCDTAFGTAALCGAGFVGLILDNEGSTKKLALVASDGTNWHRVALTHPPLSSASSSPSTSPSTSVSSSPSTSASASPSTSASASPSSSESASPSASASTSPSSSPSSS